MKSKSMTGGVTPQLWPASNAAPPSSTDVVTITAPNGIEPEPEVTALRAKDAFGHAKSKVKADEAELAQAKKAFLETTSFFQRHSTSGKQLYAETVAPVEAALQSDRQSLDHLGQVAKEAATVGRRHLTHELGQLDKSLGKAEKAEQVGSDLSALRKALGSSAKSFQSTFENLSHRLNPAVVGREDTRGLARELDTALASTAAARATRTPEGRREQIADLEKQAGRVLGRNKEAAAARTLSEKHLNSFDGVMNDVVPGASWGNNGVRAAWSQANDAMGATHEELKGINAQIAKLEQQLKDYASASSGERTKMVASFGLVASDAEHLALIDAAVARENAAAGSLLKTLEEAGPELLTHLPTVEPADREAARERIKKTLGELID